MEFPSRNPPAPRFSGDTGTGQHYTLHPSPTAPPKKYQRRYLSIPPLQNPNCRFFVFYPPQNPYALRLVYRRNQFIRPCNRLIYGWQDIEVAFLICIGSFPILVLDNRSWPRLFASIPEQFTADRRCRGHVNIFLRNDQLQIYQVMRTLAARSVAPCSFCAT